MNRQKQLNRLGLGPARPILISSAAPVLLRGRGRAQPASLPMQLRGQRQEEASHPLCPASTQQPSSCHVWRTPAAKAPTEQEPEAPISPQLPCHGRDCQTPAREFREQQRLAGYISLLPPLEESSSPCGSLTRLSYVPVSLQLLALSPYPKR